jgi:hypothetical protein
VAVLQRNKAMHHFLVANGCDYRFRSYVQARHCFSHWHSFCASVVMGEKPSASAALLAAHAALDRDTPDNPVPRLRKTESIESAGDKAGVTGRKRKVRAKRSLLRKVAMSKTLESGVSGVIVLNTICMMMDMDRNSFTGALWQSNADFRIYMGSLELLNTVFTCIFTVECVIKIVGMGRNAIHGDHLFWPSAPLAYFRNGFNLFDFSVVVLTGVQIPDSVTLILCYFATDLRTCSKGSAGVSVLRMFRLARLVRLVRAYPQVQQQVMNLIKVARPAAAHCVIICIFIAIFAIMGKDLLGAQLLLPPSSLSEVAIHARVYVRAHHLEGGFERVHPARVLRVHDAQNESWPILVEVVRSWAIFADPADNLELSATISRQMGRVCGLVFRPLSLSAPSPMSPSPREHCPLCRHCHGMFRTLDAKTGVGTRLCSVSPCPSRPLSPHPKVHSRPSSARPPSPPPILQTPPCLRFVSSTPRPQPPPESDSCR